MLKKIVDFLLNPPKKFYSDYTPLEKAYWGLWKRPSELLSRKDVLDLNKDFLNNFRENFNHKKNEGL